MDKIVVKILGFYFIIINIAMMLFNHFMQHFIVTVLLMQSLSILIGVELLISRNKMAVISGMSIFLGAQVIFNNYNTAFYRFQFFGVLLGIMFILFGLGILMRKYGSWLFGLFILILWGLSCIGELGNSILSPRDMVELTFNFIIPLVLIFLYLISPEVRAQFIPRKED